MPAIEPIERMIGQLARLPGVGRKTAQRLAYYILSLSEGDVDALADALSEGKRSVRACSVCGDYATGDLCAVCRDDRRDPAVICVVRDPRDVAALERVGDYRGLYHVLHGALSPMEGIGPEDIRIRELIERVSGGAVREVILATNPDIEGEATASYIARLLKPMGVLTTRIAHGVPVGGDLEYTDDVTLSRAMAGRREV